MAARKCSGGSHEHQERVRLAESSHGPSEGNTLAERSSHVVLHRGTAVAQVNEPGVIGRRPSAMQHGAHSAAGEDDVEAIEIVHGDHPFASGPRKAHGSRTEPGHHRLSETPACAYYKDDG